MRQMATALAAATCGVLAFAASNAQADHEGPFGSTFGIAGAAGAAVYEGAGAFWSGPCDLEAATAGDTGVGTPPALPLHCVDHGTSYFPDDILNPVPPIDTTWEPGGEPSWRLATVRQAGAHPDVSVSFWMNRWDHSPALENPGGTSHYVISDGEPKDVVVKMPPGFVGDPNALPRCSAAAARHTPPACPPETQVGMSTVTIGVGAGAPSNRRAPVWNVEPRKGHLAEFITSVNVTGTSRVNIPIVARARTEGDFGIDAMAVDLPAGLPFLGQTMTLWGVPWAASHDKFRVPTTYLRDDKTEPPGSKPQEGIPETGLPDPSGNQPQPYRPSWGPIKPFTVNPTECAPTPPLADIEVATWRQPGVFKSIDPTPWSASITGCEADKPPFDASMSLAPTSSAADSASGLTADLTIPQADDAPVAVPSESDPQDEIDDYVAAATAHWKSDAGLSSAQLQKAVVTLPRGVSLNPASAAGLAACSDADIGLQTAAPTTFDTVDPFDGQGRECPSGSKIGSVEVYSPVVPRTGAEQPGEPNLAGDVVLGTPKKVDHDGNPATPTRLDPQSGQMFRLFLVLRNADRGLLVKLAGSAVADPTTGQMTTTFDQNPRVPFETMSLQLKGGQRGVLALQQRCEASEWSSLLTPWTAAHGGAGLTKASSGAFTPTANCAFGFAPHVAAGMSDRRGGGSGTFSFTLSRSDGEQWLSGLSTELPSGLLAAVGNVPLCSNAQANAGACPEASRIGTVDAASGSGAPFFLEKKGAAYLTEGYKGAPFGMTTVVPVEAGPFAGDLALDTVVVRQALRVDPTDATATVESDPFPQIVQGIPLRIRQVTVRMDRPGFMRNPTDCAAKAIVSNVASTEGALARVVTPFQAAGCGALAFRPRMTMRVKGTRKQMRSNGHPSLVAKLAQPAGQAAIAATQVRLPRLWAFDPKYERRPGRGLCPFDSHSNRDAGLTLKDDPACPAGSRVGTVKAVSPLLARPLTGAVYFAKNERRLSSGNTTRTTPALIVTLRGEIAVNLKATTGTGRGNALVTTFPAIPDAPVSSFELRLKGGKNGVLLVTESPRGTLDVCRGKQVAEVDMDAHNGRRRDFNVRMQTPACKKKRVVCKTKKQRKTKACKRRAARRR